MNLNSVNSNNEIYEINSCKNELGFGGGPTYEISWLIDWLIDSLAICNWFTLFLDIHIILLCLFSNPVSDSVLRLVA